MTNLKEVNIGQNRFCGPAVLSILTGKSTDECASVIGGINGEYTIKGVQLTDLLKAADKLGFKCESVDTSGSLFGTITRLVNNDGIYIITLPKHFVVIETNDKKAYFCDNHTKEPIPAASSARLSQRVLAAHKVYKKPEPKLMETKISIKRTNFRFEVFRESYFDIEEANHSDYIGSLRINSIDELSKVVKQLQETK